MLLAEEAQTTGGSSIFSFLPIILIIAAMYFLLIRPNNKRRREELQLQSSLAIGDEVRTGGGLYGTIISIDDETVTIEASPGVELRYARGAINRVIKKIDEPEDEAADEAYDEDPDATRKDRD